MKRQRRAGYSLVEVICVLAIVAILAVIAVPGISRLISNANEDNCSVALEQFVKDIQLDCAATRFANLDAADTLIREKTERAADTAVSFSTQAAADDGRIVTCETDSICPNNGTYALRWTLTPVADAYAAQLTMEYSCTCTETTVGSFTMLLALKHPMTLEMDFYDALKSNLAVLRQLSETQAKEFIAAGQTAKYCALKLAGRISVGARLYQCKGVSGGTAVNPVSLLTTTTENLNSLLTIDPMLGTADNNVLWGITINDAGEVEWLAYYCRYIDTDGKQSTYFVVWSDGEFVTTKENYYNIANATAKEYNPPIEGSLGSAAAKADWIETVANQNKNKVSTIRTCGMSYKGGKYNTHWNQRDGNWYVQAWGIYEGPNFGRNNVISKRKLSYLTASYASGTAFSPEKSLVVTAHYEDGTTADLPPCTDTFLDTRNLASTPSVWYLTNGYFLADSASPTEEWHTVLTDAQKMIAASTAHANAFAAREADELTIVYREYYKYIAEDGSYAYTPVTKSCKLSRSFVDLRLEAGAETHFTLADLLTYARFRVTMSYTDADGNPMTDTLPELAEELLVHRTASQFAAGQQGGFFRLHSASTPTAYVNDATLLRNLGEGSCDLDVIYYAPKRGTVQLAGRLTRGLDHLSASYTPHPTQYFYLDRLSVTAEYAVTLTDTTGQSTAMASRALPHREKNKDGFLMTLHPDSSTDAADWASGTDNSVIRTLVGGDGTFTLGLLYEDIVLRRTDLEIAIKPTQVLFVWSDISIEYDMPEGAVCITDYFGDATTVVFPYYVTGKWIIAPSELVAVARGYIPDDLYYVSDSGIRYYYINDGSLHTVERIGLLKPSDLVDENFGPGSSSANNVKPLAVKLPEGVTGIDIPEGVREIGVFAFQNKHSSQTETLTDVVHIPASMEKIGRWAFNSAPIGGLTFAPDSHLTKIYSSAFENCKNLSGDVALPEGLESLSNYAFHGCTAIGSLTIPSTVTRMGENAFADCGSGTGALFIYGGTYNTTIENGVFDRLSFRNVTIGKNAQTISTGAFQGETRLTGNLTLVDGVQIVDTSAFSGCNGFDGTLTLPDSLVYIGQRGFKDCKQFSGDLLVPSSVTRMDSEAFGNFGSGTGKLTLYGTSSAGRIEQNIFGGSKFHDVTIGGNVVTVAYAAFNGCSGHTGTLTLEASVKEIFGRAFYGCSNYDGDLLIPETVTQMQHEAFYRFGANKGTGSLELYGTAQGDAITSGIFTKAAFLDITIGGNVREIGSQAFQNGKALGDTKGLQGVLTIQAGVTTISDSAFEGCSLLGGNLTLPDTVTTIGYRGFSGCTGMTGMLSFDMSDTDGIREIGQEAFSGTRFTGDLVLPSTLRTIGYRAFYNSSGFDGGLTFLSGGTDFAPTGVTTIGDEAFSGCRNFGGDVTISATVTTIGHRAFVSFGAGTGALYLYGESTPSTGKIDSQRFDQAKFRNVTIGGKVTTVGKQAFQNCTGFTGTLTLEAGVTTLDYHAFYGCSGLTGDLAIPETVTMIEDGAFQNCYNFDGTLTFRTRETQDADGQRVVQGITTINANAFSFCERFTGDLVIPETVTTLGDNAFGFFGQYGGVRDRSNPSTTKIDLSAPSLGSLYCYAKIPAITSNMFRWTHFDNVILIDGAQEIAGSAFIGQTARYFVILGKVKLQQQSLARGYRHPKFYLDDDVISYSPFYQNTKTADNLCPEGYYNEVAYVPPKLLGMTLRSNDGKYIYLERIATHDKLRLEDFAFYRVVCAAVGVTLPPDFSPSGDEDPLAAFLGCDCEA